jgi:hypothetical protein
MTSPSRSTPSARAESSVNPLSTARLRTSWSKVDRRTCQVAFRTGTKNSFFASLPITVTPGLAG